MLPPIGPPFKQPPQSHRRLQASSELQTHQTSTSRATHGMSPSHSVATTSRAGIIAYVHPMHSAEGIRRRSKTASSQTSVSQDSKTLLIALPSPVMTLLKNAMTNNKQKDELYEIKEISQRDSKEWSQEYPTDESRLAPKLLFFGSQRPSSFKMSRTIYMLRVQIESHMCSVVRETEKALYAQMSKNISKTMNSDSSNQKDDLAHIIARLKEQTFLTTTTVEILHRQIARAETTL